MFAPSLLMEEVQVRRMAATEAMDESHLLNECHGLSLRIPSDALSMHLDCLSVFARMGRKKGILSNKICCKLVAVDDAFSLLRHITHASLQHLVCDLKAEITAPVAKGDVMVLRMMEQQEVPILCRQVPMTNEEVVTVQPSGGSEQVAAEKGVGRVCPEESDDDEKSQRTLREAMSGARAAKALADGKPLEKNVLVQQHKARQKKSKAEEEEKLQKTLREVTAKPRAAKVAADG
eukprot:TRINITY_DN43786_c0_g1_i1.p1 TRINITY_DN43786_c0_g1~~TRINITY_DN43786_c0_g1_i1.p1  ORF type:complete len:234 (-),score=73.08 TRINITY_DN43786_c0_g1_i1:80-781(-)